MFVNKVVKVVTHTVHADTVSKAVVIKEVMMINNNQMIVILQLKIQHVLIT